jgi:hypothetical protein
MKTSWMTILITMAFLVDPGTWFAFLTSNETRPSTTVCQIKRTKCPQSTV